MSYAHTKFKITKLDFFELNEHTFELYQVEFNLVLSSSFQT
jgi:hypothetical protein